MLISSWLGNQEEKSIEKLLARQQLRTKTINSNSWFYIEIKKILIKYNLQDPEYYLDNPKTKRLWIRDQPFNLRGGGGTYGFMFRSEMFFRTTRELEYLFFLSRKVRNLFPEFNIRLYDKNSESDYFFFSTKIRIFFSVTLGIRIFF